MRRFFIAVFLVVACATGAAAGPLEGASSALQRGDFTLGMKLLRPLAEQGNAEAQYNLGVMYAEGKGVPQDDRAAVQWWRKAAAQGDAEAQYNLGLSYRTGRGVPQDVILAFMWFSIAGTASNYNDVGRAAMKRRDDVVTKMTAAQIGKAQEMARRCQDTKFKECD